MALWTTALDLSSCGSRLGILVRNHALAALRPPGQRWATARYTVSIRFGEKTQASGTVSVWPLAHPDFQVCRQRRVVSPVPTLAAFTWWAESWARAA